MNSSFSSVSKLAAVEFTRRFLGLCSVEKVFELMYDTPSQHLELFVVFLKPLLNSLCRLAGCIILLNVATATKEYCCCEGVYLVFNSV